MKNLIEMKTYILRRILHRFPEYITYEGRDGGRGQWVGPSIIRMETKINEKYFSTYFTDLTKTKSKCIYN